MWVAVALAQYYIFHPIWKKQTTFRVRSVPHDWGGKWICSYCLGQNLIPQPLNPVFSILASQPLHCPIWVFCCCLDFLFCFVFVFFSFCLNLWSFKIWRAIKVLWLLVLLLFYLEEEQYLVIYITLVLEKTSLVKKHFFKLLLVCVCVCVCVCAHMYTVCICVCVCMRVYMCRVCNLFCSYAFVLTDVVFLLPFQNELCAATQSLAQQLRAYEIQVRHCTDIRSKHSTTAYCRWCRQCVSTAVG